MDAANQELLQRYVRDRADQPRQRLSDAYAPLVYAVCRRFLHRPQDVEDAAQETFLRLARHADRIEGSLTAWLSAAASSASVDLIRRAVRERRRREELAHLRQSADLSHHLLHRAISEKLFQALLEIDEPKRRLIVERFVRKTPMRILAGEHRLSVSAISRRVSNALAELASVLSEMGVESADELTLAEHFGDPLHVEQITSRDPLRFAVDWRAAELLDPDPPAGAESSCLPGWTRPIRVGVLISYRSTIEVGSNGPWSADLQLLSTRWIPREGVHLVSVIEPDSAEHGPIERAMREHELIGGLIDGTDAAALKTLDVILLGWNISMDPRVARALHDAVRSGVGLLNEYWTGNCERMHDCPEAHGLMLAGSFIHGHHSIPHGRAAAGRVVREHPLLPGLRHGMPFPGNGCGPVYKPADGAAVLAVGDALVEEAEHQIPGLGATPMPLCVTGHLGAGRVWVINTFPHERITPCLSIPFASYLRALLLYLADPKRQ